MKKRLIFPIAFITLFILLSIAFVIAAFHDFASDHTSEVSNFLFYLAYWPSLVLKVYPYVISQNGEIVYEMMGGWTLRAFVVNVFSWGMVGLFVDFVFSKIKNIKRKIERNV